MFCTALHYIWPPARLQLGVPLEGTLSPHRAQEGKNHVRRNGARAVGARPCGVRKQSPLEQQRGALLFEEHVYYYGPEHQT